MSEFEQLYKDIWDHKERTGISWNTINTYSVAFIIKGDEIIHKNSYQCYGWTGRGMGHPDNKWIVTYQHTPILPYESEKKFLRWVCYESPYRGAIANSVEDIIKHRFAVGRVDMPSNIVYAALFSIRMIYERPKYVSLWVDLVERGIPENIAFMLIHCFVVGDVGVIYPGNYPSSDHMTLYIPILHVGNFLKGKIVFTTTTLQDQEHSAIFGVQRMHYKNGNLKTGVSEENKAKWDLALCKVFRPITAEKVNNNPFLQSNIKTWKDPISKEEAVRLLTEHWEEIIKEVK